MAPWMSVVIPAYNEEMTVAGTVSAMRNWLEERGVSYEIVVVDNASTDRTVEVVEPLTDGSRVRLLRNEANRGKGYSVRRGMLEAAGELRLMCDADCLPSLVSLDHMVELIGNADVVIGSRNISGSRVDKTQPLGRRLASWNFLNLCRLVLGEPSRDIFCGFKLFRSDAAQAAFSRQSVEGWAFDIEVLAIARRLGYRIRETGIVWNDREGSRLSMTRVVIPVIRELFAARRNVRRSTGPQGVGFMRDAARPQGGAEDGEPAVETASSAGH
jgi:glycosyltransferase involved in cell wall biosynthesis